MHLGENMSATNKSPTQWEKGQSGNPKGRPKGTGRPISGLRRTLNKLREHTQEAMDILIAGMKEVESKESEEVKKEKQPTPRAYEIAKWLVQQELAYTRGAIAEESARGVPYFTPTEEEPVEEKPKERPRRYKVHKAEENN